MEFNYNPELAQQADNNANKLEHATPYVGSFRRADAVVSSNKGTHGIEFEFVSPNNGATSFTWWIKNKDGGEIGGPGPAFLSAAMYLMGLQGLKSAPGKVRVWDDELKERVEVDGEVYPQLLEKKIGMVFQQVLETGMKSNKEFAKLEPYGLFQPETNLMVSELRDKRTKPEKLDKLVKGCKVKDARKKGTESSEPAQPALGAIAGDF